jgi:hypothetical protein
MELLKRPLRQRQFLRPGQGRVVDDGFIHAN